MSGVESMGNGGINRLIELQGRGGGLVRGRSEMNEEEREDDDEEEEIS